MTRMVDMHAEEVSSIGMCTPKWERQISIASTALPSPELSRMVSPTYDSEFEEIPEFSLEGLPDDTCEVNVFEGRINAPQNSNAGETPSNYQPAKQVMNPCASSEGVLEKSGLEKCMLFGLTLSALSQYHYGLSFVGIICIIMGIFAGLMILPGAYLYIVKGCRPEDCDEAPAVTHESSEGVLENCGLEKCMLFGLTLSALCQYHYGLSFVRIICIIMGIFAVLMILPGAYLYIVKGCRPEDCDEAPAVKHENLEEKDSGVALFWLVMYSFVFVYSLCSSVTFRCMMGGLAVVMLLPGIYLFVLGGCRPEDCRDD